MLEFVMRFYFKLFLQLLIVSLFFSGCSSKTLFQKFVENSKKHNVNYKTMMAICKVESNHKAYAINVNKSIFNIQRGSHYFDTKFGANLYMDTVLDPLFLNYDIGICQVNSQHLDRFNLDNEDLLDIDTNIETAAKIYLYNMRACKNNIRCALSMYNTGKKNSKTGRAYANKVLSIRDKYYK